MKAKNLTNKKNSREGERDSKRQVNSEKMGSNKCWIGPLFIDEPCPLDVPIRRIGTINGHNR